MDAGEEREAVDGAREEGRAGGLVERRGVVRVVLEQACRLLWAHGYGKYEESRSCERAEERRRRERRR